MVVISPLPVLKMGAAPRICKLTTPEPALGWICPATNHTDIGRAGAEESSPSVLKVNVAGICVETQFCLDVLVASMSPDPRLNGL